MLQDGENGVIIQRNKQSYAISPHIPCGVTNPQELRRIADAAEKYGAILKITSAARIALVGLKEQDIDNVWADLNMPKGAAIGLCIRSIKACPGTTFCKRGIQDSLGLGLKLSEKYHGMELPGKFKLGVSGCPNQCAETCIKDIGLVGMPKGWKLLAGGNGGVKPRLSLELAKDLSAEQAIELVDKIIRHYKANAKPHQRLGSMIDKTGFETFKTAVLGG